MRRDPTEFRKRFAAWKDGKKPYDGGRIAEVVITPDLEYNLFLNTLPDNQRLTPEENYTTHRYWELNDKPKNFSLAVQKGMYTMEPDGWHANTVSENKKTGEIEFMKPWNHPSINYEYDWYRSKDGEEFRKQYKHVPSFPNAKYVPRFKDGKLPGYKDGTRKVIQNNYTNAKFNDNGIFTDDTTKIFDDLIITPNGVTTRYGSYTDKNWNRYKLQEDYFKYHDQLTGKVKAEPGLEIVSPEFDAAMFGRQLLQHVPRLIKPKTKSYFKYTNKDWDKAYFDAIKSGDLEKAQQLRDAHFIQKANNTKVSKNGTPIKTYHTVNEAYPADFTEFNPDIEGTHSAIYTSDSPIMSGTYTNRIVSEPERNYYINAGIENMKDALEYGAVYGLYKKEFVEALKNIDDARRYVINRMPQLKQAVMPERQKQLYVKLNNPLVIEGHSRHWNNIPISDLPKDVYEKLRSSLMNGYTTRDIEAALMATGNYDGAIIKNITDYGSSWKSTMGGMKASDVYQVNSPNSLKLADVITYDNTGKIIPLSKRDNFNIADFRYAIAPVIGMGTFYKYAE